MTGGWQPIETAPRDGSWTLLWCDFGDACEPVVARWTDTPIPSGGYGPFVWLTFDEGAIAKDVPTNWKHVGKPRRKAA